MIILRLAIRPGSWRFLQLIIKVNVKSLTPIWSMKFVNTQHQSKRLSRRQMQTNSMTHPHTSRHSRIFEEKNKVVLFHLRPGTFLCILLKWWRGSMPNHKSKSWTIRPQNTTVTRGLIPRNLGSDLWLHFALNIIYRSNVKNKGFTRSGRLSKCTPDSKIISIICTKIIGPLSVTHIGISSKTTRPEKKWGM